MLPAVKFENEFVVRRGKADIAAVLASDETVTQLFPNTEIVSNKGGARETKTRVSALGAESIVRFVFKTAADGGLTFSKICDGKVWRALEGAIRLTSVNDATTRVQLEMEGSTRALVPEFTIRAPMKDQLQQMTRALRERLERK
jgi:carbon monoxide dehydrogenase subunit G